MTHNENINTAQKKESEIYIPNMSSNNTLVLDTKAIITGVATTLIVGAIIGAISLRFVAESNSFRTAANAASITELKEKQKDTYIKMDSVNDKIIVIGNDVAEIKGLLKAVENEKK